MSDSCLNCGHPRSAHAGELSVCPTAIYAPTAVTPPEPEGDYFDKLVALGAPTLVNAYSCRDQAQLDSLVNDPPSQFFTYDPTMDAAKYYKRPDDSIGQSSDSTPGGQNTKNMRIVKNAGTVLVTWDAWFPNEWRYSLLKKLWKVHFGNGKPSDDGVAAITLFEESSVLLPLPRLKDLSLSFQGAQEIPGMDGGGNAARPTGEGCPEPDTVTRHAGVWARTWVQLELNVLGDDDRFAWWRTQPRFLAEPAAEQERFRASRWHAVSQWFADETRGPIRVNYRMPKSFSVDRPFVQTLFFEFNTSALPPAQVYLDGKDGTIDAAGTGLTVPVGTDLSEIADLVARGEPMMLTLGGTPARGATTDPYGDAVTRPITAVDVAARTVTLPGESAYPSALTGQTWAILGPVWCWVKNWVCLHDYALPAVPEEDTFIFQRP